MVDRHFIYGVNIKVKFSFNSESIVVCLLYKILYNLYKAYDKY